MFRPVYQTDYYRDQDNDHDVLPLRWIPWEVYIMVRFSVPYFDPIVRFYLVSFLTWPKQMPVNVNAAYSSHTVLGMRKFSKKIAWSTQLELLRGILFSYYFLKPALKIIFPQISRPREKFYFEKFVLPTTAATIVRKWQLALQRNDSPAANSKC